MRMLEKLIVMQPKSAVAASGELGRRRFSENAAYIRALEPLKPLVSLQAHARIPR